MRPLAAAALGLVALAVAGGAAWWALRDTGTPGEEPAPAPPDRPRPADPGGPAPGPADAEPPRPAPAPVRARPAPSAEKFADEPPIPEPGEAVPGRGLRFRFAGYDAAEQVDWTHVGIGVRKARRVLVDVARRMNAGEDLGGEPAPVMEAVQLALTPAANLCRNIHELDPDPEMPIGRMLAHPAFESNATAAALEAWGLGLRNEQVEALRPVWDAHLARWNELRFRPGMMRWNLGALVGVTLSRRDAQARIDEILDPEQRAALRPDEIRGRVAMDFFSPVALWRDRVRLVQAPDEASVAPRLSTIVVAETRLGGPNARNVVEAAVGAWVKERAPAWRRGVRGPLSRAGYVTETEILPAIEALPALSAAIARGLGIEERPESPVSYLKVVYAVNRVDD